MENYHSEATPTENNSSQKCLLAMTGCTTIASSEKPGLKDMKVKTQTSTEGILKTYAYKKH